MTDTNNFHGLHGYFFEDLRVGMSETVSRTIIETDLRNFSGVTGDTNPMHLNREFAEATPFKSIIVHGMLTAGLISAVIGTKLPGPGCIYMSQSLKFLAPVRIGDTVYAVATVKSLFPEKRRVLLDTRCYVKDTVVIEGEALIKVPARP
ncbi:MAG: MaoC family dehydratase [Pseudomonadota bacterium]|nr:MaoC family dehydratase [Pseudomonadota bacterium]MDE3037681.1 MaoC family dehydratase [Pseudomonadota bacterium]